MEAMRLSSQEAILFLAILGAFLGYVFGFITVIYGIIKRQVLLGILGLVASVVVGAILGLILSLPTIALFVWLIEKKSSARPPQSGDITGNPAGEPLPEPSDS
jgi:hypothetical protein